jgi:dienelactone hydrolase
MARNGLAAVAVEVFSANDSEEALGAYQETSDRQVLLTLQETVEYLQSDDILWALSEKVGLLGFDVGGRPAIVAAARQPWVGSIAVVATPLTGDEEREHQVADFLASLPVAVLGLYGQDDPLIANETVDEAQARNEHGSWLLYEGAAHSFWDDESEDFDPGAAADLEARLLEFFRATLPTAIVEDLG